jgi:hypothetical protein
VTREQITVLAYTLRNMAMESELQAKRLRAALETVQKSCPHESTYLTRSLIEGCVDEVCHACGKAVVSGIRP